jgi:hypothetical protein
LKKAEIFEESANSNAIKVGSTNDGAMISKATLPTEDGGGWSKKTCRTSWKGKIRVQVILK